MENSFRKILLFESKNNAQSLLKEVVHENNWYFSMVTQVLGKQVSALCQTEKKIIESTNPSLIFIDCDKEDNTVKELLTSIKTDTRFGAIPVIVLSSSATTAQIKEIYNLRANCVIIKFADNQDAKSEINIVLNYWLHIVKLPFEYA